MKHKQINLCYYPTTIAFIDDNKSFLDYMKLGLSDISPCLFFNNPETFLSFFKTKYKIQPFISRCINNNDNDADDHITLNFNISALYQLIYDNNRFSEITTIVVDYSMPGLNGLELCRQLKKINKYIRIIMLTGEADKELAVEAFNEGLINKFILKNIPDIFDVVLENIFEQQFNYFLLFSEMILNQSIKVTKQIFSILDDPSYIILLNEIFKEKNIVEYYMVSNTGSALLLDRDAEISWLMISNDEQIQGFVTTAEYWDTSNDVLQALKQKNKIPFIFSSEENENSPNDWGSIMYPAKKLLGNNNYYYSYINNYKSSLQQNKILSLKKHITR